MEYYLKKLEQQIEALPRGYVSVKTIQGKKRYYYQWREGKQIKSRYIKKDEYDELAAIIDHRRELKQEIVNVKSMDHRLAAYAKKYYMGRPVPIGEQSFERLISRKLFYVDKTSFIKEWWSSKAQVTLITRPRRFGKTLNMSMTECFFSTCYANRPDLFEGLRIWSDPIYRQIQGTYPVIKLSFASIKNISHFRQDLKYMLVEQYFQHQYLKNSECLNEEQKRSFQDLFYSADEISFGTGIRILCELLVQHHGKKVIILIDEYDTPLQEAYAAGKWDMVCDEMRSLFNAVLKSNEYLEKALLTGITRVSKESLFSDLNHVSVVSVTSSRYETAFGFTEEEVAQALIEQGMGDEETRLTVKKWYDGFNFGRRKDIYNPWSIVNFLSEREFKAYWANTSSHALLRTILGKGDAGMKRNLEKLIHGESIEVKLHEDLNFQSLDQEEQAVWNLMLLTGYLKPEADYPSVKRSGENPNIPMKLKITNYEARLSLERIIHQWFMEHDGNYNEMIRYLLREDYEAVQDYMSDLLLATVSVFDVAGGKEEKLAERFYHGLVLGLLVDLRATYDLWSNGESGYGRYDIMLIPKDQSTGIAYIMEFKLFQKRTESSLSDTVCRALQQIEEKRYDARLLDMGIAAEQIRKLGIGFKGKEVQMEVASF